MIPLSNGNGTSDGVYDAPCEVDKPEHTSSPCTYEVPSSSTLPLYYETALGNTAEENDMLQGKPDYNMGCHDDEILHNPTAMLTDGNTSEHEYQEADLVPKSAHPLLEVSVLSIATSSHSPNVMLCTPPCMHYIVLIVCECTTDKTSAVRIVPMVLHNHTVCMCTVKFSLDGPLQRAYSLLPNCARSPF